MKTFKELSLLMGTISLLLLISSCAGEEKVKDKKVENSNDVSSIETLFDQAAFEDPSMESLLKELNLCNDTVKDLDDYMHPACSPKFFKFFKLTEKTPYNNGFLLQVKSKVSGFPLRRLLIFVRENGLLVKVNGFVANLIGRRKVEGPYDDLLLRFNDNVDGEITFYNCYYRWNGGKYEFLSVEVIEGASWGGPVKEVFKDSMNLVIKKVITDNKMVF